MELKGAFREIIMRIPEASVIKEDSDPKDLFKVINIRKGNEILQLNSFDIHEKIKNKDNVVRYLSDEIRDDFKIYALALLGVEHLEMLQSIEDAVEGRKIFEKSLSNHKHY